MEQAKTNLGTKELHKNKSVMIEGGMYPRAKVMDQHVVDRYLMNGTITLVQHRAAEHLLQLGSRAGEWPTGADLTGTRVQGSRKDFVPAQAFALGRVLVRVKKRYGWFHAYLVKEVVLHDWDVAENELRMKCLREALNLIADKCMGGTANPMRLINGAAKHVKS